MVLLLLIPTQAAANGVLILDPDPVVFPNCGNFTVSLFAFGEPPVDDENVIIGIEEFIAYLVTLNGWQVVEWAFVGAPANVVISYPPGTTKIYFPPFPEGMTDFEDILITFYKDCACRPTGRYVYTLLGNYPCNLITVEETIPARFLNPAYTGPLCNLPNQDHSWNGEWVKNEERSCGGYLKGGNHYDTSLGILP